MSLGHLDTEEETVLYVFLCVAGGSVLDSGSNHQDTTWYKFSAVKRRTASVHFPDKVDLVVLIEYFFVLLLSFNQ